jgi:release factor glutamine methyltransferase
MAEKVQTIIDIHHNLSQMFEALYPAREASSVASIIIEEFTGLGRAHQMASGKEKVSRDVETMINAAAKRVASGEPLQYVLGYTLFCGHRINVTPAVLIPRPETEEMTALIIEENKGFRGTTTDYCTGSGCIAVSIALVFPGATVHATDISTEAIKVASRNALHNNATINFHISDIFSDIQTEMPDADIIISNPPYVRECEKKYMRTNVLDHEPQLALFVPDDDPLKYYNRLAEIALVKLSPNGKIYLEINEVLATETAEIFTSRRFKRVTIIKDINGKDRILKAERDE